MNTISLCILTTRRPDNGLNNKMGNTAMSIALTYRVNTRLMFRQLEEIILFYAMGLSFSSNTVLNCT
jgi:hypothetical protein